MRSIFAVALLLVTFAASADVSIGTANWNLYRSSTIVGRDFPTLEACAAAADARNELRSYTCRKHVPITVTADTVTPPPPADADGDGVADSVDQCPSVAGSAPTGCPVAPPPTNTGDARMSLTMGDTYGTLIWDGDTCTKSSTPTYSRWDSEPGDSGGYSIAPSVQTTLTLTCANGTASVVYTPPAGTEPPPPTGGGSTGGGGTTTPPPTTLPVPTVLATPIEMTPSPLPASSWVLKYAETAKRNWSFEGHNVVEPFDRNQGYWSYDTCVQDFAVWLFDRPSSLLKLAELSGRQDLRDLAINDARYYFSKIDSRGFFSCKTGEDDTKYLYPQAVLAYERATGDLSYRPVADRMYAQSAQGFSTTYSPSESLWTERELGLHASAALAYYEMTGNEQALARAAAMVRQWDSMTINTGAPLVSYTQHEGGGPGGTQPTDLINSPWMSAFYFQFARRYWQLTGDQMVLRHASRYFDWLDANGLYDGSLFHPEFAGVTVPRYLAPSLIGDGGYDEGNLLHCPDVQGLVAFSVYAKQQLGEPTTRAQQRLTELAACSERMAANWTRDTNYLPKYRIQAPRAFNWWMGVYEAQLH